MNYIHINILAKAFLEYKRSFAVTKKENLSKLAIDAILERATLPPELAKGIKLDYNNSTEHCLIFSFQYYHVKSDMWSDHTVIIKPCLAYGFTLKVTGKRWGNSKQELYKYFVNLFRQYSLNKSVGLEG